MGEIVPHGLARDQAEGSNPSSPTTAHSWLAKIFAPCVRSQHSLQELLGAQVTGMEQEFLWSPFLHDGPLIHEQDTASHLACKVNFVGDDDHRHPARGELLHYV